MGPEAQFDDFDTDDKWAYIYHKVREETRANDHTLNAAKNPRHRSRNRYRDVSPYDHSRVILMRNGVDYINASLVKAEEANRSYILTQGPLEDTSGHFWLMVWEKKSRAVLMLNNIYEKRVQKCHPYFPVGGEGNEVMDFDDVGLSVRFLSENDQNYYTIRTLQITDHESGDTQEVLQFHYTTWPDFGVPESPAAFLDFLFAVRKAGALDPSVGPPVIHCSAGIGRSGTFCLVDTCLVLIETKQDANAIDVLTVLLELRNYRMGLIQTHDQLRFSYVAIIEGTKRVLHNVGNGGQKDGEKKKDALSSSMKRAFFVNGPHPDEEDSDVPDEPPPPPPRVYPGCRKRQLTIDAFVRVRDKDEPDTKKSKETDAKTHKQETDAKKHKEKPDTKKGKETPATKTHKEETDSKTHKEETDTKTHKEETDTKKHKEETDTKKQISTNTKKKQTPRNTKKN